MRELNYPAAAVEGLAADRLGPGVAFNLRRFGALIQLLAKSAWVQHIRSNPRNAPTVGGATDLELFLFGGARVDLSAARAALQDMQENRCFYCGSALGLRPSRGHVGAALGEFEIHGEC